MIVVDASVMIEALLHTAASASLYDRLLETGQTLHAPHLLDVEVTHVLRMYAARGELDEFRGLTALNDLADFRLHRYPHDRLLPRIWALRSNFSAYDAAYVALAEALDAPLLTRDERLARAAESHIRVERV